ncbi:beta strand repeat-containing protein [Luteolibacter soli]|uniref:Autotransporter-associated beta strand repeat-containing protein n=1 Tax=Luteolibacter soli TaxID=3135280 RepID=A0ABU9B173_9BACT
MTSRASLQALALLCTAAPASFAANLYWDNVGGTANDWSGVSNWSTVVGGGTDPAAVPGASDLAIFSASTVAAAQTVNLNADRPVLGLSFTSGQAHSLLGGGTNRTLTTGASGIDKTGAGAMTIGSATAGQQVAITISGAQTWSNSNNTGAIVVQNNITPLSAAAGTVLTLGGTSTAANQINGVIANNTATGVTSIVKSGAGQWGLGNTTTAVANTFTGGVTINAGTLRIERPTAAATLTTLGTGAVTVNSGATLHFFTGSSANNLTHANAITLNSGTIFFEDGNTVLSGTVGLTGNNTIRGRWDDKDLTMSGIVSGNGGITKINTTATGAVELILSGANTFSSASTGGVLTVNGGYVRLANANALGNTPTIFANNTQAASTVGVRLAGGITIGSGRTLILRNGTNVANDQRAALDNITGNNTWAGSIVVESPVAGVRNQTLTSSAGTLTITGNVYNSNVLPSAGIFLRGAGTGVMNGNFYLGSAQIAKTDGGTWTINSTGNNQGSTTVAVGNVVLNNTNALEPNKPLVLGQGDAQNGTLTINAGFTQHFSTIDTATGTNGAHVITGAGSLDTGSSPVTVTVVDGTAADDLTIASGVIGTGGISKVGPGALALNGNTVNAPFAVSAGAIGGNGTFASNLSVNSGGTLRPGTATSAGTINASTLTLNSGALAVNLGTGGNDLINVTSPGGLSKSGTTTINITPLGTINTASTFYPIISYTGASPGTSGLALGALPSRVAGSLTDNGSAIGLTATNDQVRWVGNLSNTWDVNTTQNWQTVTGAAATNYLQGDSLLFTDASSNTSISLGVAVTPAQVDFQNTSGGPAYTLSGAGSLSGGMNFIKSGTGLVTLNGTAAHSYSGTTTIGAGTLAVSGATSSLTGTSGVDVASGATLRLFSANADFGFTRPLSGAGIVEIDANTSGTAGARNVTLTGTSPGFSGTLRLNPSGNLAANGSFRLNSVTQGALGTAYVEVNPRGQLWVSGTVGNNATISGYGYQEAGGGTATAVATGADGSSPTLPSGTYAGNSGVGAIRLDNATMTGNILLSGDSKISALNNTGTLAGNLSNVSSSDDLVVGGGNNGTTIQLTGNNSALERIWVNGGGTTGTNTLVVGNNTTTGTLGTGDVVLFQDASAAGLRVQRSDGYSMPAGVNVIAARDATATNLTKSFLHANSTGTGLTIGGLGSNIIDLSDGTNGGTVSVGTNLTGAILNINSGTTMETRSFWVGEAANNSATVNQNSGSVALNGVNTDTNNNLRLGHWGTETSTYNMAGGTLTFGSPAPATTPSATGELAGGIYVGVDGTGVFNQSGGTVSTNFVVLDNRGDTAAGTNMPTGIDQFNITGGALELKSAYGLIARNGTTAISFGGGTVRNTAGDGTDVAINGIVGTSGNTTLDTVNATRKISLMNNITGTGTLTGTGGGTINLNPDSNATRTGTSTGTGTQSITANLAGSNPVAKQGIGTTTLAGTNTLTGATAVNFGRLNLTGTIASSALTVDNGALLGGEGTAASVTFGATAGDSTDVFIDGLTSGALTSTGALTVNGTLYVNLNGTPANSGTITVLNHGGTTATASNFLLMDAADYRSSTFNVTANKVTLDYSKKDLVWDGSTDTWEIGGADNDWNNASNDNFFTGDKVTFGDSFISGNQTLFMAGALKPSSVVFSANTFDYDLSGTPGNGIGGTASVSKTGDGNLTLGGDNTFTGGLTISNGTVNLSSATALGATGGQITVTAGGQLNMKGFSPASSGRNYSLTIAGDGSDGFGNGAITNDIASVAVNSGLQNLTLSGNATVGVYSGTLPNGNRLDFGVGGAINGNGFILTKTGDAMVGLRGPSTNISYIVAQGTLRAEDNDLAFGNAVQVNTGATLDSWTNRTFATPVTFKTGSTLLSSSGTANWTGSLVVEGDLTLGGAGNVNLTQPLIDVGTGVLTKSGAGTVILSSGNFFNRKVNVTGGVLRIPTDDGLGVAPGSPVADSLTLQGGGKIQAGNATTGVDMTLNTNRGITLPSGDGGFQVWTGFTLNYAGAVTGVGNFAKADGGTLNYTGTASHTGATNFSAGITNLNGASIPSTSGFNVTGGTTNLNAGSVVTTAGITSLGTGTLNIAGGSLTTSKFIVDDGANTSTTVNHTAGSVTITGNVNTNDNQASFLFGHWGGGNLGTYNLSGGTLTSLAAEMSFGWDSTASVFNQTGGTANLLGVDFGNGRNNNAVYTLNGGRLNLGANGMTTNGNKSFNFGSGTLGAFADWTSGQALSMSGTVTPSTINTLDSVDGTTARNVTLSGLLSGNGGLVKSGAGVLTLNRTGAASNTFSGGLTVNAGTVKLFGNNDGASVAGSGTVTINAGATVEANSANTLGLGTGAALAPVVINGGSFLADQYSHMNSITMTAGTVGVRTGVTQVDGLDMRVRNTVNPAVTSLASASLASISSKMTLTNNLTVTVADGAAATDLQVSGVIVGGGTLTKAGTGTLELTGVNTYTGATSVNAGLLKVNTGSLGNTAVTVATTGTLGGTGSIAGATTVQSGGTLAPGNSAGTLNFGSTVNLQTGSTYAVEITGAVTSDKVVATGILTANGTIAVTLNGYTPTGGETFDIADAASITGTPTFDFSGAVLGGGLTWDTTAFATTGVIKVSGGSDPYTAWAALYGATGGKAGDDDNDGENNLLEFATNSNPVSGTSRSRAYGRMHVLGAENVLTYTVAVRKSAVFASGSPDASKREATKDGVKYSIEASNEVGIWNVVVVTELAPVDAAAVQAAFSPALPTLDADWEWHTFRTDGGAPADPRDFVRLNATQAP